MRIYATIISIVLTLAIPSTNFASSRCSNFYKYKDRKEIGHLQIGKLRLTPILNQAPKGAAMTQSRDLVQATLPENSELFKPNMRSLQVYGVPAFLDRQFDYSNVIAAWGGRNRIGSGVHIGDGFLLTARHVYIHVTSVDPRVSGEFSGNERINVGLYESDLILKKLPKASSEMTKFLKFNSIDWNNLDKYTDWALFFDRAYVGKPGISHYRNASEVKLGEPLWILGRPSGSPPYQIAVGTLARSWGDISVLENTDLIGGFSGGPVVDGNGYLVGIVFGWKADQRQAAFVNIESIIQTFQ